MLSCSDLSVYEFFARRTGSRGIRSAPARYCNYGCFHRMMASASSTELSERISQCARARNQVMAARKLAVAMVYPQSPAPLVTHLKGLSGHA